MLVHTGVQDLSTHAKRPISDLLDEINDASSVASYSVLSQADLHKAISSNADGTSIRLEVMLHDWGQCKHPYSAYYGQVEAADIGRWWADHQQMLFAKNLRKFTGSTDVNNAIKQTLVAEGTKFWYFNNGITILCNSLKKKAIGGSKRTSGVFVCDGVSVVNGAQTVGCIGEVAASNFEVLANARVSVRLISLANCPEQFGTELTRAANTQNRIERRDFAALDPEQERIRKDLKLELDKTYFFKSGESPSSESDGCTIEEATIALACASADISLAVQAKREVGKLWEDITRSPYKLLFNPGTSALRMWRLVEVARMVDTVLKVSLESMSGRDRMIAVHGNRFILHEVFHQVKTDSFDDAGVSFESIRKRVNGVTESVLKHVIMQVEQHFPSAYMNSLFKNATKCKILSGHLSGGAAATHDGPTSPTSKRKRAKSSKPISK